MRRWFIVYSLLYTIGCTHRPEVDCKQNPWHDDEWLIVKSKYEHGKISNEELHQFIEDIELLIQARQMELELESRAIKNYEGHIK